MKALNRRSMVAHLLALGTLPTALASIGCPATSKPGIWVVAVDRSGSTAGRAERGRMLDLFDLAVARARARRATVDLWAFAHDPVRIAGPAPLSGSTTPFKSALLDGAGDGPDGTLPGRLMAQLADDRALQAAAEAGGPLRIVILTDGGIDDTVDPGRLRDACVRLARRYPAAQLVVVGIRPELRGPWDEAGKAFAHYRCATDVEAESVLRETARTAR
jgi:hypothetical protein